MVNNVNTSVAGDKPTEEEFKASQEESITPTPTKDGEQPRSELFSTTPSSTVVSPKWEISTPWWTIITPDVTTDVTEPTPISTPTEAIEWGIQRTEETIEAAPLEKQERLIEEAATKDERTIQAGEFAQKREGIIEAKSEAIAQTEEDIQKLATDRAVRDADALNRVKTAELTKANLIVEEQRLTNKISEVEAETKIETAKQQATWAFNKLWLGFSSGIILEVQRIATKGATELAKLKVTGARLLASTRLDVAKLEQSYSAQINNTIDKYTDISIANKKDTIQRISDVQNNLLLNSKQKEDAINKIEDGFRSDTRKIEDDYRTEQERLSDKLIDQTFTLQEQVANEQNQERTTINNQFSSGSWFTLTDSQRGEQLAKAGLSLEDGAAMEKTTFSKTISSEVDSVLWKNITLTWDDRGAITELSKDYMEGWLIFSEATKRATLDYIDSTPRLRQVLDVQEKALSSRLTSAKSAVTKGNLERNEKNEFVLIDERTWLSTPVIDSDGNPLQWFSEKLAELEALWLTQ